MRIECKKSLKSLKKNQSGRFLDAGGDEKQVFFFLSSLMAATSHNWARGPLTKPKRGPLDHYTRFVFEKNVPKFPLKTVRVERSAAKKLQN